MTREDWARRNNRGSGGTFANQRSPNKEGGRLVRDRSKVKCFNYHMDGHFAIDCTKPKRTRDQKAEVNMAHIDDDELALLLTEHGNKDVNMMLLNEEKVLDKSVTGQVKFGDGSMVEKKGNGTVSLKCKTCEERELQEVFFIPSLCNSIISLGQLSEAGNKVVLNGDFLWVYEIREIINEIQEIGKSII
ncbi:uncharacterized protein LOC141713780 [Apium graveolens]|uniref:uncharacterized protein LOC141713780 n=1 Tax=Apium graveolens TaxID=4045 RepID=UPI003D7A25B9